MYNVYSDNDWNERRENKTTTTTTEKNRPVIKTRMEKNEQCTWVERNIHKISSDSMNYHFGWINSVTMSAIVRWAVFQLDCGMWIRSMR